MKHFVLSALITLVATQTFAATVRGARIDASKKVILVDVTYGGGCGKHDFSLEVGGCMETNPVRCSAKLVHKTQDFCEALISNTVAISLSEYKLDDRYYSKGSLTITGDHDWQTKKPSSATVILP